ncbi:hypothetical protein DI392_00675 [Vibrio albus]|uniref:Uncharacterized protein n=1 Tax=Vibrio albus TaxID=2200953 RepID=A0A2U3BDE8_9VIBR|nr:hypothetical protein [Vibrio albus]PWI34829.1 hypothetical protein DI392_00675 [Vibrio albus]
MSRLDTRGFMDGALRGFDMMDRHYTREHSLRQADERMKMQRASHEMGLRQAEQTMRLQSEQAERSKAQADRDKVKFERDYGTKGEDGQRTGGRLAELDDRAKKESEATLRLRDAQIEASQSTIETNAYNLTQTKKKNYLSENLPLIQRSWDKWNKTGEVDDILKNEYVAGTAYDPARYLNKEVNSAFDTIETKLPEIVQGNGSLEDPELVDALGVMYQNQIRGAVGQQDPITGKTIKGAKLGGVHLAQDIHPDIPGNQPGIVLTTMVDYGDGNWVAKPITNNRSTDPNDTVKVIPLETAMKDITSQLALRRQASTSKAYKQLFGTKDKGNENKLNDALIDLETEKAKAIGKLDKSTLTDEQYQATVQQIESQFDQSKQILKRQLSGNSSGETVSHQPAQTNVPIWANGDQQKFAFARAMQNKGINVAAMSIQDLNDAWLLNEEDRAKKEEEARATEVIRKVSSRANRIGM